jgi:hypothetical protein
MSGGSAVAYDLTTLRLLDLRDSIESAICRKVLRPALAGLRMTSLVRVETRRRLYFRPQVRAGVFWIQLRQLSKELFRSLISGHGDVNCNLNDFISAHTLPRC